MKETRFIVQNKEKWLESEKLLINPVKDPEKLSSLFTQVVDDLSYSRTYYPNRSVRVYLNKIARQYFSIIYSHKRDNRNAFKSFWLDELPQIILYSKKQLLISLFVFVLSVMVGVFSSYKDPDFATTILGEDYITMTKENIEHGDPMAVYKKSHQVDMFLGITFNNLMVAFRTYVFGIFMAIGTLVILLYNGVMVGSFQFFFIERDLFIESALSIWLHGTLEISSIILAGGAGLTLGSGLLFPGTYSRLQAFQLSAMRSLKLMLGIVPILIFAAIIESFLTRYTNTPDVIKLILIILSACFIAGYFVIYPWLKSKRGFERPLAEVRLPPSPTETVSYSRLKNNAEILKDTFLFYSRHSNKLLSWILPVALCVTAASFLREESIFIQLLSPWWEDLFTTMTYALKTTIPLLIPIHAFCTAIILYRVGKLLDNEATKMPFTLDIKTFLQIFLIMGLLYGLLYLGGWGAFFSLCSFGFLLLISFSLVNTKGNIFHAISESWKLMRAYPMQLLELQFILLLLSFSFLMILSAPLIYVYTSVFEISFTETDTWAKTIIQFIERYIKIASFYLLVPVLAGSTAYLYFTLREINTASHLKDAITKVGVRSTKNSRR